MATILKTVAVPTMYARCIFWPLHFSIKAFVSASLGALALPSALASIAVIVGHITVPVYGTIHGATIAAAMYNPEGEIGRRPAIFRAATNKSVITTKPGSQLFTSINECLTLVCQESKT